MFILKSIYYRVRSLFLSFNLSNIKIGRSVIVSSDSILENDTTLLDYCRVFRSQINSYSYISPFSIIINAQIGKYCSIGPGCRIGLGIHPIDQVSTSPYFYNDDLFKIRRESDFENVMIGNDVWIGANVLIMGGVKVGDGAVIGAGAVVTKDVPAYSIVVGVPAKVIRYRFSDDICSRLSNSGWWNKEHNKLIKDKSKFVDIENFLSTVE